MNAKTKRKPAMVLHIYEDYSHEWLQIEPTMKNNLVRMALHRALIGVLKAKRDTAFKQAEKAREEARRQAAAEAAQRAEEEAVTKQTEFLVAAAKKAQIAGLDGDAAAQAIQKAVEANSFEELDEARRASIAKASEMAVEEAQSRKSD